MRRKPDGDNALFEWERTLLRQDRAVPVDAAQLGEFRARVRNLHMEHPDRRLVEKVFAWRAEQKEKPTPDEGAKEALARGAERAREHVKHTKPKPFTFDNEGGDAA